LFVFHESVLAFSFGLVALVVMRALLLSLLVRSSWPGEPPPWRTVLKSAAAATLVAVVLLSPWGDTAVRSRPGARCLGSSLPPCARPGNPSSCSITGGWWAIGGAGYRRRARSPGWACPLWALSLAGLAVSGQPAWMAFPATAAAGLFNAWAWHHSVGAIVSGRRVAKRRLIPATVVVALAVLVVVVGGAQIGFAAHGAADEGGRAQATPMAGTSRPAGGRVRQRLL